MALLVSLLWFWKSQMDYEPAIAFISSIIALITLSLSNKNKGKNEDVLENSISIKGNENNIKQINFENKNKNSIEIEGNSNDITQM